MKTVTRFLIFLAAVLVWLVILVFANAWYLNVDDPFIVGGSLVLGIGTTFVVAKAIHS